MWLCAMHWLSLVAQTDGLQYLAALERNCDKEVFWCQGAEYYSSACSAWKTCNWPMQFLDLGLSIWEVSVALRLELIYFFYHGSIGELESELVWHHKRGGGLKAGVSDEKPVGNLVHSWGTLRGNWEVSLWYWPKRPRESHSGAVCHQFPLVTEGIAATLQ